MSGCEGCSGCGGCPASTLELTKAEMELLRLLGQVAFLPVARRPGDEAPVSLEEGLGEPSLFGPALMCLERKRLVCLDETRPLKGTDPEEYRPYPIRGSVALTQRGQQVLELLEIQGYQE